MRNPRTWHNAAALSRAARGLEPAGEGIVGAECREQSRSLADAEVFSLDIPFNRTADQSIFNQIPSWPSIVKKWQLLAFGENRCAQKILCEPS
jgi:hypothetical protein